MVVYQQTTGSPRLEEKQEAHIYSDRLRSEIFYDKFRKKIEEEDLDRSFDGIIERF